MLAANAAAQLNWRPGISAFVMNAIKTATTVEKAMMRSHDWKRSDDRNSRSSRVAKLQRGSHQSTMVGLFSVTTQPGNVQGSRGGGP